MSKNIQRNRRADEESFVSSSKQKTEGIVTFEGHFAEFPERSPIQVFDCGNSNSYGPETRHV